jgi:hypothetical protein
MSERAIPKLAPCLIAAIALAVPASVASATPVGAGLPVSASSISESYLPEFALDGKADTRWASDTNSAPQWLQIDFGKSIPIPALTIHWEHAYAQEYEVQMSDDARQWRVLAHRTDGFDGTQTLENLGGQGRYLRIWCIKYNPWPLFSIWEVTSPDKATAEALLDAGRRTVEAKERSAQQARQRLADSLNRATCPDIIFAVRQPWWDGHWYANFGYYAADANQHAYQTSGGKLCRLNLASGKVTALVDDPHGTVRDPQVDYDAKRIVFSYRKSDSTHFHLFEISPDGTGLRQLTDGDCDDIEPVCLPDGGMMFCSSRCNRWVNCWLTQVAILYRCDADGRNVRPISSNAEQDNTPWVTSDGRVMYTRWEYVDRSQVDYHHLWTCNPDGADQMVFFGNLNPSTVMIDAKPIPGSTKVVSIFSPGHGRTEHEGQVEIVDHGCGPDDRAYAKTITADPFYRDPFPIDSGRMLIAKGTELQLMDMAGEAGTAVTLYALPEEAAKAGMWLHEPRLLAPRPREPVVTSHVDLTKTTGRLLCVNVNDGRNMTGVKPGDIKKLLVLETLPKPINYTGGMEPLTYGGSFTLERVVGTVPVEPDGSAYMELPALRSFFFVALDDEDRSVKRMQSFLTVQPGEMTGCVGCHEQRTRTFPQGVRPMAARRAPSTITPIAGVPDVFDFPRDIQPILDRHCVQCHDYERATGADGKAHGPRAGSVILSGDRGPMYSHSYFTLTWRGQFSDGRNQAVSNRPPRSIGAVASPIMAKVSGGHHGVVCSPQEIDTVRYWIESGAPYPGTYAALGSGMIGGYYSNGQTGADQDWPETRAAGPVIERRCLTCHTGDRVLPRSLSQELDGWVGGPGHVDPRLRFSRHIVFNLSRPEKSMMLLAPLAKEAGGFGLCRVDDGKGGASPVFASREDAGYKAILAMCEAGKTHLDEMTRFDMPTFRAPMPYLREMARYGIIPAMPRTDEKVDSYQLDRRYWESLWFHPAESNKLSVSGGERDAGRSLTMLPKE